jgi:hypothetical protein
MKFTTVLVALGFVAAAAAQSTTSSAATSTATISTVQKCLNACATGDVTCQASCLGNPSLVSPKLPNHSQTDRLLQPERVHGQRNHQVCCEL